MSIEVIKPENEQPQPRTWQQDMEDNNRDYSRPDDKRLNETSRIAERAEYGIS